MADKITSVYDLDVTAILANLDKVASRFEQVDTQIKANSNDPFKEASQGAKRLEKELSSDVKKVAELDAVTAAYTEEIKRLNTELRAQEKQLKVVASASKYKQNQAEVKALKEEIKKLNAEIGNTAKQSQKAQTMLSRIKGGFMGAFAGVATGGGAGVQAAGAIFGAINPVLGVTTALLGSFASKAFEATAQWQGYEVALKNSLGSQELANKNLSVLEELAVRLPVGLGEVTESFNQLVNRGFKPTKDELSNLSGFAAAQNKTFDQLIQAILDAEQGEVERLKEFGIQTKKEGENVSISFRGVTKTFQKGAKDSATAFADLARELGSDKLNADKMETLDGRMSNLADTSDRVARKFGEILLPAFEAILKISSDFLDFIGDAATGFTDFDKSLKSAGDAAEYSSPRIGKLFDILFSPFEGKSVGDFFFALSAGFEKLGETLKFQLAQLNPFQSVADMQKNTDAYLKNLDRIDKTIEARQKNKASGAAGDFQYGAGFGSGSSGPSEAELKLAEKRKRELQELERKLQEELLKIENEFGKEKLEALKDNELAYIEAKKKFDLAKIDQEEKALLRLKQIVSGARKGQYDRNGKVIADTNASLTDAERAPFDFRRDLVNSEAAKDQAKFINDAEKQITEVLSNEYQKQLQATEYKYEELFKLAKKSGVDIARLEKEKQKELAKINTDKSLADLEKKALQEQGDAELNIIRAQIDGRTDLELDARKGLLEIEKKFLLQKIEIIEASGDEESAARIAAIKKIIAGIDKDIDDVSKEQKKQTGVKKYLQESLGMSDDDIDAAIESAKLFASSMKSITSELYNTLNQLSDNRIQRINDEISKKEEQVKKEKELNEEGVANNLDLRLKELADLKAARERALEDQKRLQRTQMLVDTATQASAMITASSKVYAGFAGIPVVGVGLGIAAVALMLGAFAAAKIKSFQLVNQQTPQFKKGGRHTGRLHSEGGELVEVERDEWTINRKSSIEHDELLEAINKNDRAGIMDYLLTDLLDGTGVSMSDRQRRRDMMAISGIQRNLNGKDSDLINEVRSLREELIEIKKSTSKIPAFVTTSLGDGKVLKEDTKTGSKEINDISAMIKAR